MDIVQRVPNRARRRKAYLFGLVCVGQLATEHPGSTERRFPTAACVTAALGKAPLLDRARKPTGDGHHHPKSR